MSCSPQSKTTAPQTNIEKLNDFGPLVWKCPGPAYSRGNSDGSEDHWGSCFTELGNIIVVLNRGAIVSLGNLISSDTIAPKTFNNHAQGETYISAPVNYVSYSAPHDPSTIRVGYEVTFAECTPDAFTLYVKDKDEDGALEALEYTFETMKHSSYCNL